MKLTGICFFVCVCTFISGCDLFINENDIVRAVPKKSVYTFSDTTQIFLSVTNHSSSPIYFSSCDNRTIQKMNANKVVDTKLYVNTCECICIAKIGEKETVDLFFSPAKVLGEDLSSDDQSELSYRIIPHLYFDDRLQNQIPFSLIRSGVFSIKTQ